jgi:hypothetical protein
MQVVPDVFLRPTLGLIAALSATAAILGWRAWRSLMTPTGPSQPPTSDWPSFLRSSGAVQSAAATVGMLVSAVALMFSPSAPGSFHSAVLTDVSKELKQGASVTTLDTKGVANLTITARVEENAKVGATLLIADAASNQRVLATLKLDVASGQWSTWRGSPPSTALQLILVPPAAPGDAKVRMIAVAER